MARTYGDDAEQDRWDDGPVVLAEDPWDVTPAQDDRTDHRWDDLRGEWRDDGAAPDDEPGPGAYRPPPAAREDRPSWLVTPENGQRRAPRPDIDRFLPSADPGRPAAPAGQRRAAAPLDRPATQSGRPTVPGRQARQERQAAQQSRQAAQQGRAAQQGGPDPARRGPARGGMDLDAKSAADRPPAEAMAGNRLLVVLLFLSGLSASVALWLFDTQPGAINSTATLLTAAGRITGLIAGYLLFIQLLMMSRVSWLEEWVGARDLLRWHRWLGTSLLVFVIAHIVFIVYGYAVTARTDALSQAWSMLTTFEDMISATIATALLVLISLLALRVVRRIMPYELWHLLHLTGYLVLLLGYGHQIAVGADLSGRFASVWWPGLGALVIAALVWGRVVEPLYLNLRHRLEVADVVAESDEAFSIYLTGRNLDKLPTQAGQFMRWRFLNGNGWWQSHPFSLSAAPNDKWLRLTVTVVGEHTARLEELEPGTKVWAEGPFGTFTAERRTRRKALLIAGGSGIAPIRALLEDMPSDTVVIYRARTTEDLVFREELDALARRRRSVVRYVVGGREDPGPRRLFTGAGMQTMVPDVHRRDIYLCGSPGLVDIAVTTMRELDVPTSQLHLDPFEF